jgi:carboxyl-terminal processing protease
MRLRHTQLAVLVALCLAPVWAVADNDLGSAYAAILRGDCEAARALIDRLDQSAPSDEVQRAHDWVANYESVISSRSELKQKTFDWQRAQAEQALADGQTFLALSFAAQGAAYATDLKEFAQSDWVVKLLQQCRTAADEAAKDDKWSRVLAYDSLMMRILPDDADLKKAQEQATRNARLELIYADEKALKRRLDKVDKTLLRSSIGMIQKLYYEEPDFKSMGEGAIDNLLTLCHAKKLQKYLDGLANPALREHFVRSLTALRADVTKQTSFTDKDLLRLFNKAVDANKESVELPEGLLITEFMQGVLDKLDDYSGVVWPADAADFDKMMMGGFYGVGIQLGLDERTNRLKVVTPLEDSPALEAGIQPDDLIVAVDGESTKGWTTEDAVEKIMGEGGTEVILTVLRPSTGERMPKKLVRRHIVLNTVYGVERLPEDAKKWNYMLDPDAGIAYLRLNGFHENSAKELRHALDDARGQGMKGLILDVRYNPGGLLDVVIDIVSLFVDHGEVVSTRGRLESEHHERVGGKAPYKDVPIVVLVNDGSASASEILAGALQDHHRAVILGERTFGKGSVQHVRPLDDDSRARLKLTTALYYLPSGRTPHKKAGADKWGVDPDWEVKLTPKEFRRVLERERDSNVIHNETHESAPLTDAEREAALAAEKSDNDKNDDEPPMLTDEQIKLLEADPYEAPNKDPQLETALLLVRVKLAGDLPWPREFVAAARADPAR